MSHLAGDPTARLDVSDDDRTRRTTRDRSLAAAARGTARAERSDQHSSVKLDHAATLPGDHALMIALHKQRPESVVRLPADRTRAALRWQATRPRSDRRKP